MPWRRARSPWVGFDPTNNLLAGERHLRVAIGRDYADVPPTRGVYKGAAAERTELAVAVKVGPVQNGHRGRGPPVCPLGVARSGRTHGRIGDDVAAAATTTARELLEPEP